MRIEETSPDRVDVTTLSTPAGRPTSSNTCATASVVSGVSAAGLTTIVQPAAMAGPILRVAIAMGKFQGVMSRHGPTGFFTVSSREPPAGASIHRPWIRTASSANQRRNSAPYATSPAASFSGLPISRLISRAKSSVRSVIRSYAARRISPRSRGAVRAQSRWAATAASRAATASSAVPSATVARTDSSAGSSTSKVSPSSASRQVPPTYSCGVRMPSGSALMEPACHRAPAPA